MSSHSASSSLSKRSHPLLRSFALLYQCARSAAIPLLHKSSVHPLTHPIKHVLTAKEYWSNLLLSAFLVLMGGVFAGLTLALMGQDEVYLKVIASSGEPTEQKHAKKVLLLVGRGKHWVLVTLLLSNVITNETLPIVLDRVLGGGWAAVVASTVSIVIFGEVIPQSICVRYGLQVGALFSPFVVILMYIMYPVAYPCALLLDYLLGEDHGTVYKKSGLKTLVTLHKTMGVERLNSDEVTIISAVLDLKEKPVSMIMTPMQHVFTMSADTILDQKLVDEIFNAGFSRIPIHLPGEPLNFIGMLLVRVLISYDPEDALPVASFPLATLPETSLGASCLNILNYFQEGKSHMIVVSEQPGEPSGAVGILTLEDVIEELIGEEIVDELDVYIDINKNIKRTQPGPLSKRNLTMYLHNRYQQSHPSKGTAGVAIDSQKPLATRSLHSKSADLSEQQMLESAHNWVPKNMARNPIETKTPLIKIKKPTELPATLLPGPNRTAPPNGNYDTIHATEEGALQEQRRRQSTGATSLEPTQALIDHECQPQPNVLNGSSNQEPTSASASIHSVSALLVPEYMEQRLYRTGGIIESIVNVKGVHKTIIENASDYEDQDYENGVTIEPYLHNSERSSSLSRKHATEHSPLLDGEN